MTARLLVTRKSGSWAALAGRFAPSSIALQWDPTTVQVPPADPRPGEEAIDRLDRYDWLAATSANGVAALARLLAARGGAVLPPRLRVAAVGAATAEALSENGLPVTLTAGEATAAGLARALSGRLAPGDRVLLIRPEGQDGALAATLAASGAVVDEAPLYRTVASARAAALALEAIEGRFAGVVFTAPSALSLWLDAAAARRDELAAALAQAKRIAIGPSTERHLAAAGLPADTVAETPTEAGVGDAIERTLHAFNLLP